MDKSEIGCIIPRHVVNDLHKLSKLQTKMLIGIASLISWKNGSGVISLKRLSERIGCNYSNVKAAMQTLHPYIHWKLRHSESGHRIASEFRWNAFEGCCICKPSASEVTMGSGSRVALQQLCQSCPTTTLDNPRVALDTPQSCPQAAATNKMNSINEQKVYFIETEDDKKLHSKTTQSNPSKSTESLTTALDQTTTATEFIDSFKAHYKVRFNRDYSSSVSQTEISSVMTAVTKLTTNHIPVKEFIKYIFKEHLANYTQGHVTISYVCDDRAIFKCVQVYGDYYKEQYQDKLYAERDRNALKSLNSLCGEFPDDKRYKHLLSDHNAGGLIVGQLASMLSKLSK